MKNRRLFLKQTILGSTAISLFPFSSLKAMPVNSSAPKISLAQWSLNQAFFSNELDPTKFAAIAKNDFQINAIEYVNAFYKNKGENEQFWNTMKRTADSEGVNSLLIMVDGEGDLGNPNLKKRIKAVENHYKWVNAAKLLGCHSIRVNAFGKGKLTDLSANLVDGLSKLAAYGKKLGIYILIENHGLHTSNASYIVDIIKKVNNPYLGTLPDFGNWCLAKEWGSTKNNDCVTVYDRYKGLQEFLPYAKGVSAKSYDFDVAGNETVMDYNKLLKSVKDANFDGFIGIEYEGERLSPAEGIKATKTLIEKVWNTL